jgi:predicted DCC family thiol-disulfide oxidoreductase YuxK
MPSGPRVAQPPERPLVVYDGSCGFCLAWIARWRQRTGDGVDYEPSQVVRARFPEVPERAFSEAVQFILPDGRVFAGAEAVARMLALGSGSGFWLWLYRHIPGAAPAAELAYRAVASHRPAATAVTHLLWGSSVEKPTYFVATALFLRLVGLCYVAAFLSLFLQVDGLVGSHGVLPIARYLDWVRGQTGAERYWLLPTLCWISSSDAMLHFLCGAGALVGCLLVAGVAPAWSAAVAWLFYLSLSVAGQVFLEFQWDLLLLETGLLAVLLVPPWRLRLRSGIAAPALALFLLRWLLFRLMFSSGWVKLSSGDATWRNLTALRYHYETQPLPPWTAWFMHQLSPSFQTASAVFLFFVELAVPFLFFAPRRLRLFACGMTLLFQALIAATGNYAFFNLLAVALAVLLIDDQSLPRRWRQRAEASTFGAGGGGWPRSILVPVAAMVFIVSAVHFAATLARSLPFPRPVVQAVRWLAPLRIANGYGLFAVMTTSRPEIILEGSDDGAIWRAYEFRFKPGDPLRRPRFVAPHQPRLDWQMWFAALGGYQENPWLMELLGRLLEGSPDVERLLAVNPFPHHPPRFVRAVVYDYRFTDSAERARSGAWWRRDIQGLYCPVVEGPDRP